MQFKVERVTADWPYLEEDYSNPIMLTLSIQERPAQTGELLLSPHRAEQRPQVELEMSASGNLGRREGLTWGGVNPSGREGRDTHTHTRRRRDYGVAEKSGGFGSGRTDAASNSKGRFSRLSSSA